MSTVVVVWILMYLSVIGLVLSLGYCLGKAVSKILILGIRKKFNLREEFLPIIFCSKKNKELKVCNFFASYREGKIYVLAEKVYVTEEGRIARLLHYEKMKGWDYKEFIYSFRPLKKKRKATIIIFDGGERFYN